MKSLLQAIVILSAIAAPVHAFEPIPGSLSYPTAQRSKLTKSPIGSLLTHSFKDDFGRTIEETYRVQPDRTLKLISRKTRSH